MKVLFLEIDTQRDWAVASIGPAFLASHIRRFGHEATLCRINEDDGLDVLLAALAEHESELIGVSLTSRQWIAARRLLNELREVMNIPVVVGGLHPTFSPDETIREPGIDYLCRGEGEQSFGYLVEALEAGVPITDGLIRNIQVEPGAIPELAKPFEPIDDLPFMARDLLDEKYGVVHMTTQRGCPFPCTYCAARMYDQLYEGNGEYGRRRSHENVLTEIEQIRANGDLNYIIFLDDTFTIHHPWVYEFCKVYGERFAIPFSLHARVETMNEKLIDKLATAGCRHITYGVESGSERVRREIMKRPVTNDKLIETFRMTREAGVIVTANYMMGIPGETCAEMRETAALHDQLAPDDFGYFVFYPYPGTHLYHECLEKGYLPDDPLRQPANHHESILDLPGLSKADIADMYATWTNIRIEHMKRRYDEPFWEANGPAIERDIQQCALNG